jgi:egghead protein (zeste-white 4 protein)
MEELILGLFWWSGLLAGIIYTIILGVSLPSLLLYWFRGTTTTTKANKKANKVKIVIVTVGNEKVLPALRDVVRRLRELKLEFVIVSSNSLPDEFNVLVVPKEEDGSKFKAIKWFVKNFVEENCWYVFLDDDSYPLDDYFLYEIPYWESKGRLVGNGIIFPRQGRSRIAYALDWIRYFDDLTRFRFQHVLGKPFFGLHGELLIVRGDVLKDVWLKMEESVTEDFCFAMHLMKKGIKTFQVMTKISVKSPNSLRDLVRQRKRWGNIIRDAMRHKNFFIIFFTLPLFLTSPIFAPIWFLLPSIAIVPGTYFTFVYLYASAKARLLPFAPHALSVVDFVSFLVGGVRRQRSFLIIDKT